MRRAAGSRCFPTRKSSGCCRSSSSSARKRSSSITKRAARNLPPASAARWRSSVLIFPSRCRKRRAKRPWPMPSRRPVPAASRTWARSWLRSSRTMPAGWISPKRADGSNSCCRGEMMNWARDETAKALLILALVAAAGPAPAQDYPTRPIKALTTTSAGGISDVFMRALGDELLKRWGQPIVVENRPGGMQNVGARACTEAPPDGYTICILNAEPIAYNQFLLKSMPFDPEKGHQPLPSHPDASGEFATRRQDDRRVDCAVQGQAGHVELSDRLSAARALYGDVQDGEGCGLGARAVQGRRRGGQRGAERLHADRADRRGNVIGQIRAGTMTPLVMLNNIRSPNFLAVPTLAETGYTGPPSRGWYGLFTPAGTAKPIVDKLAKEVAAILDDPAFRARHLSARSLVPAANTPEEFAADIRNDRALAQQVVKAAGLEPQ